MSCISPFTVHSDTAGDGRGGEQGGGDNKFAGNEAEYARHKHDPGQHIFIKVTHSSILSQVERFF